MPGARRAPAHPSRLLHCCLGERALAYVALSDEPRRVDDPGEEMLRFWVEHRLAVVVLLDRAERRAKIIAAEGEHQAAEVSPPQAADVRPRTRSSPRRSSGTGGPPARSSPPRPRE